MMNNEYRINLYNYKNKMKLIFKDIYQGVKSNSLNSGVVKSVLRVHVSVIDVFVCNCFSVYLSIANR